MKPGSMIVSAAFEIPGWDAEEHGERVFVYRV